MKAISQIYAVLKKYISSPYVFECPVFWRTVWSGAMAEFWLISAPGEKTCQQTWDRVNAATSHANNLSTNNKFTIPDLKVKWSWFSVLPMLQRFLMSSCPKTYIVGWLLSHKLSVVCVILPYDVLAPHPGWDRLQVGWMKGWSLQSAIYQAKLLCFCPGGNTGRSCRSVRWAGQTGLICRKVWLLFTATEKKKAYTRYHFMTTGLLFLFP